MKAFEFDATIQNGMLAVPADIVRAGVRQVRVILLENETPALHAENADNWLENLKSELPQLPDNFEPLSRQLANER